MSPMNRESPVEHQFPELLAKLKEGIDKPLDASFPVSRLVHKVWHEDDWWAPVVGAAVLLILLGSLALVAAGGWGWFAGFLSGTASNWAQAIGGILAVIAAFRVGRAQINSTLALEKARQAETDLRTVVLIDAALLYVQGGMSLYRLVATPTFPSVPRGTCEGVTEGKEILRKLDLFKCPSASVALAVLYVVGCCDLFVQRATSYSEAGGAKIGDKQFADMQRAVWDSGQLLFEATQSARKVCASLKTSIEEGRGA